MSDRQHPRIETTDQLHELITRDAGKRETHIIDGVFVVQGADGKRYELPAPFVQAMVEAHVRVGLAVELAARIAPRFEEPEK